MCKVCELEAEAIKLQDEVNFRVQTFIGELRFNARHAAELRTICMNIFIDLLDKMEVIESTRQQFDIMNEVSAKSDLKH